MIRPLLDCCGSSLVCKALASSNEVRIEHASPSMTRLLTGASSLMNTGGVPWGAFHAHLDYICDVIATPLPPSPI